MAEAATRLTSLDHLSQCMGIVEQQVRRLVEARRAADSNPDDRFRGLYVGPADLERLLRERHAAEPHEGAACIASRWQEAEAAADAAEAAGAVLRLRDLARSFGLDAIDLRIVLAALAPDLDPRFEQLYGYLNDDVTRRRASIGVVLELAEASPDAIGRARFAPLGALVSGGLVVVEDAERPFLSRGLRVPDRVVMHLLGDDTPDASVAALLSDALLLDGMDTAVGERALAAGALLLYVHDTLGGAGRSWASTALARSGRLPLSLDLDRLARDDVIEDASRAAIRDARLVGGGLVAGPLERLAERGASAVRVFAEADCPTVLLGKRAWDPSWSRISPLVVDVPSGGIDLGELWRAAISSVSDDPGEDASPGTPAAWRLGPEQILRTARAARRYAAAAARPVSQDDLRAAARLQNAAGLEALARRVVPAARLNDLVLSAVLAEEVHELLVRCTARDGVIARHHGSAAATRRNGVTALFAGASGTGKTLSAEVLAGELGLDLYIVDLATVVDKYIGETEKNLDRIFVEAEQVNGVLLFDEADALFGKRSEVRDSRDRYANLEIAYLLQLMERSQGLTILTTNLRSNLDDALVRRIDAVLDFGLPDAAMRGRLWRQHLGDAALTSEDIDVDFLAGAFSVTGGEIRNICLTAAFLASATDRHIGMADVVKATEREYRKMGRLCVEAEFGTYSSLLRNRGC